MMKLEIYCFRCILFLLPTCSDFSCTYEHPCSLLPAYSSSIFILFYESFSADMGQYGSITIQGYNIIDRMTFNFNKKQLFNEEPIDEHNHKPALIEQPIQQQSDVIEQLSSFDDFSLHPEIVACLKRLGYDKPTKIQAETLRHSLKDQDLLCLSQTGSGKTLSFVLPILNYIKTNFAEGQKIPYGLALIIGPTRELCIQINEYFERFRDAGLSDIKSLVLYGGIDAMKQVLQIAKKPNIIVATPGRILDHLLNTKGFHLNNLKFLVLDQADKLLNKDFQEQFNQIISMIPQERRAYLFSATLTNKVQKLQRVSLKNPVKVQVSTKYQTVSNLQQFYIFIPSKMKDCYLVYLLNQDRNRKTIVFAQTRLGAQRITLTLHELGFNVQCLHGDMSQIQRIKSLNKFKADQVKMLICTDVAARGIDISMIEFVINYDLCDPKNYVHRVGRTARIGRMGKSVTFVTQYDVEAFKKIQEKVGMEMKEYPTVAKDAEVFLERLELCHQQVSKKMKKKKKESFFDKLNQK